MQDSNNTRIQLYRHFLHPYITPSISAVNIQCHSSISLTLLASSKPNLSPIYISQQQLNSVKQQGKRKHKDKDQVLDTKSELGTVSTYITPKNLLERMGINLRIYYLILLSILRMLDKSQKYLKSYYSKTPLPNSTPRGFNIKLSTFIYNNPLNQ